MWKSVLSLIVTVFLKCTTGNTKDFKRMLKRVYVSDPGLKGFLDPTVILEGMQKSSINTFEHKINIFADAELFSIM